MTDDDVFLEHCDSGMRRFMRGDYREAIEYFSAALKLDPSNVVLYTHRGDAHRLLRDYERAIADFDAALALSPSNPVILVSRAIAYHQSAAHEKAIADCTAALEGQPDHAPAYRTRAAAHLAMGAQDTALADLNAAIDRVPEDDEALYERGVLHARKGAFEQAIADFSKALQLNPYHIPAYLQRGDAHRSRCDYVQAIHDYTEVLRHHPSNVVAISSRGLAYRLKGDLERAIADYSAALRLEANNAQVLYSRGVLYRAQGELDRAEKDLNDAIRLQSENWPALYHRGKIRLSRGQYEEALADLTEALHLNPKLLVAYLSRALARDRLGQFAEAITDGNRAVKLASNSPLAHLLRGMARAHAGKHEESIDDLSTAVRLDPSFALAYQQRSLAYTLQGDYQRALDDCNQVIALECGRPQAYALRSIVHHLLGNVQQALVDHARALQLDPRFALAGLDPALAETTRTQTTQQLGDLIDGLRSDPPANQVPPPPDFRIVIRTPTSGKNGAAAGHRRFAPKGRPITETRLPPAKTTVAASESCATLDEDGLQIIEDETAPSETEAASDNESENAIAVLLTDEPANEKKTHAAKTEAAIAPAKESTQSEPAPAAAPVVCPLCRQAMVPSERLSGGRVRCANCKAVFLPSAGATAARSSSAPASVPSRSLHKQRNKAAGFKPWHKPAVLAASVFAAVVLLYACFPRSLFGNTGQLPVHPAQGKVLLDGQPLANATICLHPVGTRDIHFPRPRAVSRADGSFVLGTYGPDDGAPVGEFKVTVQCFKQLRKVENESEGAPLQKNVLPPWLANPETSRLSVRIKEGDNDIPALVLTP